MFISKDVWEGLRCAVDDQKVEDYEDIEFVEEEPKIATKEDRKIRIHSLKKSKQNTKKREPSNIKNKINTMNTINQ